MGAVERLRPGADEHFREDVIAGLCARPRTISPRWFYDHRGSELFEEITRLPEYYLTRAERVLLQAHAREIAALAGPGRALIELGSGSSAKTGLLLEAIAPAAYVPMDISADFLRESASRLARQFPSLPVHPLAVDFMRPFSLPQVLRDTPRVAYFAGSTIGNMTVAAGVDFLRNLARVLGPNSLLLIGIDRIKDPERLLAAYDDSQGVTAQFNLNLLHRINRELQACIPVQEFRHVARWNDHEARIEMHLQALSDVDFALGGRTFRIPRGETIHTENSLKYGPRDARALLRAGWWAPRAEWTHRDDEFALILASAAVP
jgi:dimethylhistidine N-methyltransferase